MARGPEARRQDKIVRMFKAHGWLVTKISSGAGWTDLLAVSPSAHVLFAEIKSDTGVLRPLQRHFEMEMKARIAIGRRTNVIHIVWNSVTEAADWLHRHNRYELVA